MANTPRDQLHESVSKMRESCRYLNSGADKCLDLQPGPRSVRLIQVIELLDVKRG